jgi:D-sedoheptulose 7-phosphate isomerase
MKGRTMRDAIMRKCRESVTTKEDFFGSHAEQIIALCHTMAEAFQNGNRLFVMGNGGSACDAQHVAVEFTHPIIEKRRPLPAIALTTDTALLTAIGNDKDFAHIFSDQIKLHGRAGDMALGISTSGQSPDIIYALQAARTLGMLTIGFSGMDGGRLAGVADFTFVVPSFSIHRIQETHVTLLHIVWDLVHVALGEEDVI